MIDYHAHAIALDEACKALAGAVFADPKLTAARSQIQADLSIAPNHALLGCMLDQIFAHSVSDGTELALLTRAADLWKSGVGLCSDLASIRQRLETALGNPADPASLAAFNSAAMDVQFFAQGAYALQAQVMSLRADIAPNTFLTPHPRQSDEPSSAWDWENRMLGRRTDAFVRSLNRLSHDPPTRALAFGALTGYAANVAGSAYLGVVVGGPRRSHRFRDRLARNTVGSWLSRTYPLTPSPAKLAQSLRFGSKSHPTLPSGIGRLLKEALKETFDLSKTPAPPDLQLGYSRMLEHLNLLDNFKRPPTPDPPQPVWLAKLYGDPSNPPPSLRPQDVGLSGDPGGGVSVGNNAPGNSSPNQSDNSSSNEICGIIVAILIILDVIQAFVQCIVQWAEKKKCTFWDNMLLKKLWEKDPPDPRDPPTTTDVTASSSGLTAMASSGEITQFIGCLFDIHNQLWEALDRAYNFLAFHGLIYPGSLIDAPLYGQFTTVPLATQWPRRSVNDPIDWYHLYPFSQLENPTITPSAFPSGSHPDAFLSIAINRFTIPLWEQMVRGDVDSSNLDLDADRGFLHLCWATTGSINDDPVNVSILAYEAQ